MKIRSSLTRTAAAAAVAGLALSGIGVSAAEASAPVTSVSASADHVVVVKAAPAKKKAPKSKKKKINKFQKSLKGLPVNFSGDGSIGITMFGFKVKMTASGGLVLLSPTGGKIFAVSAGQINSGTNIVNSILSAVANWLAKS